MNMLFLIAHNLLFDGLVLSIPHLSFFSSPPFIADILDVNDVVTKNSQQWMWFSWRKIQDAFKKKRKQQFLTENHVPFCLSCPRSRLELLLSRTISIQMCDYMCRLYLHVEMNEADNSSTEQEVPCDVTFP